MSEGMSVFLPSSQDEIDEVIDIIPSTLKREKDENNRTQIIEDVYSGLYIRMSDMVSLKVNDPNKVIFIINKRNFPRGHFKSLNFESCNRDCT